MFQKGMPILLRRNMLMMEGTKIVDHLADPQKEQKKNKKNLCHHIMTIVLSDYDFFSNQFHPELWITDLLLLLLLSTLLQDKTMFFVFSPFALVC